MDFNGEIPVEDLQEIEFRANQGSPGKISKYQIPLSFQRRGKRDDLPEQDRDHRTGESGYHSRI